MMVNILQNFNKFKPLLANLISRDIKVKYRRSILGVIWSVLNPLLMMIIISIVFSKIFRFTIPNFPIYYLTGSLIFNFFSEATNTAMTSVVTNAPLLKKVYIPKYLFPLQKTISALVNLGFSFIAIVIVLIFMPVQPTWLMLLTPVPILYTLVFSLGLGMALSALAVFVRDVYHLFSILLIAWTYLTPIFYPVDILPESVMTILKFNPLYHFIDYFRNIFMYGVMPTFYDNLICMIFSGGFLLIGVLIFKKTQNKFVLYL